MKNDKLIPGLVLVFIGAAILLANYGYLHFHLYNIWRLWPIFLVIGGVNLVFANNKSPWATILKISVLVFGLGLICFGNFGERYSFWPHNHFSWRSNDKDDDDNNNSKDDDDDDDDDDNSKGTVKYAVNGAFNEPYTSDIKMARLDISGAATTYDLSDTTNQLFNAATTNKTNTYIFTTSKEDSVNVVHFELKDHDGINYDSNKDKAFIRLNPNPVWQINVSAGATKMNFDLSKFKVKGFKLDGGAGSFTIKLGSPMAVTNVEISNAAADVNFSIPRSAACRIETDSFLSGDHFDGIPEKEDGVNETPGFDAAKNKFTIHISSVISGFHLIRY